MTIENILKKSKVNIVETEILLSAVLKKDRSFINSFPETLLTKNEETKIDNFIERRHKQEPVPYILGFKEFYGLKFFVNKDALIPRPETEDLVSDVLDYIKNNNLKKITIVDVGTGSGCIAITLATKNPNLQVIATDISEKALEVARKNARLHKVEDKIQFIETSLLQKVDQKIDIIAANLPYIPTVNYEKLPAEIHNYEPKIALDSGANAKTLYNELFSQAKEKLNPYGQIFYVIDGDISQVSAVDLVETLQG